MHRRVAAQRRAGDLGAAVRDHFIDVHVELGATARHPDVQREHIVMLASEDFVARLDVQRHRGCPSLSSSPSWYSPLYYNWVLYRFSVNTPLCQSSMLRRA